ncbi:hypothetical protein CYY_005780 [Polysphondylium violaceum]|uniref:Transmembrane protein n=1 Tax=Polysphondylium violaceum TaxID=133409 RepID=A0A8J4PSD8_9MYCE|nr:hypothetical protein CYY_005780 [Polysphondylium violaceum]
MKYSLESNSHSLFKTISLFFVGTGFFLFIIAYLVAIPKHPEGFERLLLISEVLELDGSKEIGTFALSFFSLLTFLHFTVKNFYSLHFIELFRNEPKKYSFLLAYNKVNLYIGIILVLSSVCVPIFPVSIFPAMHYVVAYLFFISSSILMVLQLLFDNMPIELEMIFKSFINREF